MAYVCAFRGPNPLSPSASSVDGLHRREEQDVADGVGVGEQHDQAIHAEAEAAGGGQDGLVRPSKAVIRCAAGVFTFLRGCFRSAGRAVSSGYAEGRRRLGATFRRAEKP